MARLDCTLYKGNVIRYHSSQHCTNSILEELHDMADKPYAQTIQRALNDEIAALLAQQPTREEGAERRRAAAPPAPPAAAPAPASSAPPPLSESAPAPAPVAPGSAADEETFSRVYGGVAAPVPQAPPAPSAAAPLPKQQTTVASLDQRITRLIQVRDWIQEDGDIARLIDTVIGRQVRSSERRQARFAIVLNVIFLLAGWLLSLVATPGHLFGK
jgi:hypothetical protein